MSLTRRDHECANLVLYDPVCQNDFVSGLSSFVDVLSAARRAPFSGSEQQIAGTAACAYIEVSQRVFHVASLFFLEFAQNAETFFAISNHRVPYRFMTAIVSEPLFLSE